MGKKTTLDDVNASLVEVLDASARCKDVLAAYYGEQSETYGALCRLLRDLSTRVKAAQTAVIGFSGEIFALFNE